MMCAVERTGLRALVLNLTVPPSECVSFVIQLTFACEAALRKVCDHAEYFYRNVNSISTFRGLSGERVCLESFL